MLHSLLKYPGHCETDSITAQTPLVRYLTKQLGIMPKEWNQYSKREKTRREHLSELKTYHGLTEFSGEIKELLIKELNETAIHTEDRFALAEKLLNLCYERNCIFPRSSQLEELLNGTILTARRECYTRMLIPLSSEEIEQLDTLLQPTLISSRALLIWLKETPLKKSSRTMNKLLARIEVLNRYAIPQESIQAVPESRLRKLAAEGLRMTPKDLLHYEPQRRSATLIATVVELRSLLIDRLLQYHEEIVAKLFREAKRDEEISFIGRKKYISRELINYVKVVKALITARENGSDPYEAMNLFSLGISLKRKWKPLIL